MSPVTPIRAGISGRCASTAPLFVSLFVGVAVKEANLKSFVDFLSGPVLYGSTLFLGGYFLNFVTGGKYNPPIGMAGVSCVPTTAKLAQKEAAKVNPGAIILPRALGANTCGVITTAILCGIYTTLLAR